MFFILNFLGWLCPAERNVAGTSKSENQELGEHIENGRDYRTVSKTRRSPDSPKVSPKLIY